MKTGSFDSPEGLWLIDKPAGISSFGVVARMRGITGIKKIGHAGTLDPLASGLMLVLVGKTYTRQADQLIKLRKSYEMQITLGYVSTTDDAEGELTAISTQKHTLEQIRDAIETFKGEIQQKPPAYSAIKVQGQRAYKLARKGQVVDLPARTTTIFDWQITSYSYPYIEAIADVSSGTYIRSLAHDLGANLGTGAYLSALRRLTVGEYSINDAISLPDRPTT